MRSFALVLRFELAKAFRSRLTWVTLLLPILITILSIWLGEWIRTAQALASGSSSDEPRSAYFAFSQGVRNGLVLGGVFFLFYASMLIANEGNLRTFKTILLRAHPRLQWVAAKYGLLLILGLVLILGVVAVGIATAAVFGDFVDVSEEGYVFYTASFMTRESLQAVLLVLPPMVALAAFGLMVSALTDSTGIATSACIGAYVFLEALKGSLADARLYLFNSFMPSLLDTSYFVALQGFAEGNSDAGVEAGWILFNLATPAASAVLFLAVTAVVFGRRDFAV